MAKEKIKYASAIFLCWIGLMAIVCIPSFIAGVSCAKSGKPVALLNASTAVLKSNLLSLSNTAEPDRAEQTETSSDAHPMALEWNVKYTDVKICSK